MARISKADLEFLSDYDLVVCCDFEQKGKTFSGRLEPDYYDCLNNDCMVILAEDLFTMETAVIASLDYPVALVAYVPLFHIEVVKILFPKEMRIEHLAILTQKYPQFYFEVLE